MNGAESGTGVAVALRSTTTIVGMTWQGVPNSTWRFAGTVPIPGKVELLSVNFDGRIWGSTASAARLQLAIASEVPSGTAELNAGDQLFPNVNSVAGQESELWWYIPGYTTAYHVGVVLNMQGRRFVGGVWSQYAGGSWLQVTLGLRAVVGGELRAGHDFLSGELLLEQ